MEVVFILGFGAACSWFWMRSRNQRAAKDDIVQLAGAIIGNSSTADGCNGSRS